ncbi:MAG: dihydrofolate reductase [Burkholderiales bacterium]|nr:MAG: dihydrofolate reductase [Burkholderiales bacterium]
MSRAGGRMPRPRVTIIVARARNGVIGRGNALPWRLPEDLAHFKRTTTGHSIVMGRRTFESIGRALPQRRNIVVTSDPAWSAPGVERAASLEQAIALCAGEQDVFVIGGAQLYAEALEIADGAIVTEIDAEFDGDAHFPALGEPHWQQTERSDHVGAAGLAFAIVRYRRVRQR